MNARAEFREFFLALIPFAPAACSEPKTFWSFSRKIKIKIKTELQDIRGGVGRLGLCSETLFVPLVTVRLPFS
jgi:hypothetical protein